MIVQVNGKPHDVPEDCNATGLVELLDMQNDRIAMEINKEIVPRSTYTDVILKNGDKIEIVRAIGGG